ncbi:MAG: alpha/beta hydrolase [Pseudomonadota bacterium]
MTPTESDPDPTPRRLDLPDGRFLAYHRTDAFGDGGRRPGVVFLGGFRSDMTGTKATWLEAWARRTGRAFLRFDYTGHGASSGAFDEGCIGDWAADAYDAVASLTDGPQILVGSSMGGWIALLLLKRLAAAGRGDRIVGFVGVAAAPDFTADAMEPALTAEQRAILAETGRLEAPSPYDDTPNVITQRLLDDGRAHLVLRERLAVPCPVRLLHGAADAEVSVEVALRLLGHIDCQDARLTLVKDADHRMSAPADLALLIETIEAVDPPAKAEKSAL